MSKPEYMKDELHEAGARHARRHARHALLLGVANIMATFTLAALMIVWLVSGAKSDATQRGWSADQQRALAARLHTDGMSDRAFAAFSKYLDQYSLSSTEVARVSYLMGEIKFDQQRYDDAIECFYRAGVADPSSSQAAEAGRKIVTCLDRLGRTIDARYALDRETALHTPTQDVRGAVVAKVGNDAVTLREVQNEIQKLSPAQQQELSKPERQAEFLRQYVAQRLLFKKGMALGIDRKTDVRDSVAALERQLVVQSLLDDEVKKRAIVERGDVKLFYEAHPELFTKPAKARASVIVCTNRMEAEALLSSLQSTSLFASAALAAKARGGLYEGDATQNGMVAGLGSEPALAAAIVARKQGMVSNVVAVARGFAVAKVESCQAASVVPFTEAQEQAERLYRAQKEQQAVEDIITEMMKAERVQLYPEQLAAPSLSASGKQAGGKGK